jgi:membrane-associated protein
MGIVGAAGAMARAHEHALDLLAANAPAAAGLAAFLETLVGVGVVLPGGTVVILAGFAAGETGAQGFLRVAGMAALGMLLGAAADYALGRAVGRRLVPRRAPWRAAARWRLSLQTAHRFLARWGWWAILAANLLGPGRAAAAFAAGASCWSPGAFLASQAVASVAWGLLYTGFGYFAAGTVEGAETSASAIRTALAVLVALSVTLPLLLTAAAGRLATLLNGWRRATKAASASGEPARRPV